MSIILTPDQEQFIQTKLQGGNDISPEEILAAAFQLLDDRDCTAPKRIEDVQDKIYLAI